MSPVLEGLAGSGTSNLSTKIVVSNPLQPVIGRQNKVVVEIGQVGPQGPQGPPGDLDSSALDTDPTLAANSDDKIATQKATRAHVSDRVRSLSAFATSGSGSVGDPWMGWDSALLTERSLYAELGYFRTAGSAIAPTTPVELVGVASDLVRGTVIQNPADTDFLSFGAGTAGSNVKRVSLQKIGTAGAAGAGIHITAAADSVNGTGTIPYVFEDVGFYNSFNGFQAEGGNKVVLDRVLTGGIANDGVQATNLIELIMDKVSVMGAGRDCYRIDSVGGIYFNQSTAFAGVQRGLRLLGTARHVFAQGLIVDVCTGHGIEIAADAYQMFFANCWSAASVNGHGLYLNQNAADTDGGGGLFWSGGTIRYNGLSGVRIGGLGAGYYFTGVGFGSNGVLGTATDKNGVIVEAGREYFSIQACLLGSLIGDAVNIQENGVRILAGASNHYQVRGNVYRGHTGANVIDGGTGLDKWVEHSEGGADWVTPVLISPWVAVSGSQPPRVTKHGRTVTWEGLVQNSSGSPTSNSVATIPVGYRPAETVWCGGFGNTVGLTNAGDITPAAPVAASGLVTIQISYRAEA